jgi:(E)-4-hydroxy-3-methylbut-2-enyl-diphosphate synthase
VRSQDDADALPAIAAKSPISVIADIHFQPSRSSRSSTPAAPLSASTGNIRKFDDTLNGSLKPPPELMCRSASESTPDLWTIGCWPT